MILVKKQDFDLIIKENLGFSYEKYLDKPIAKKLFF